MYNLEGEFEEIRRLRKNVDMNKYQSLKESNTKDVLYGWAFENDDVLYESIENIKWYDDKYIYTIVLVYIEILNNCQKDSKN